MGRRWQAPQQPGMPMRAAPSWCGGFHPTRRDLLLATPAMALLPGLAGAEEPAFPVDPAGRFLPLALERYRGAMMSGGPGKDGIPSIDRPAFMTAGEADGLLDGGDLVIGLELGGVTRAYPQRILVWHEIVNDVVGGIPLSISYCPLTGTVLAFERLGAEFGVSGRLVNSNLVMFDRASDTFFPQILAIGIKGPHAGAALRERPVVWTTWRRWVGLHPGTEVLSLKTRFARDYARDPYGTYNPVSGYYDPPSRPMFPVMNRDQRFEPKHMVLAARSGKGALAFDLEALRRQGRLDLEADGADYAAVYDEVLDTGYVFAVAPGVHPLENRGGPFGITWPAGAAVEPLNSFQAMWFAWAAFYPETALHG